MLDSDATHRECEQPMPTAIDLRPHARMLKIYEAMLRDFESGMTRPVPIDLGDGNWILRLPQRDAQHAILLKLAMVLSGMNAAFVLLHNGHILEQAAIQRMIDEANEDILFLVLGVNNDDWTDLHKRYLDSFWAEEFDDFSHVVESHKSRDQVRRKKIHAYNARHLEDPSRSGKLSDVIHKLYSGFVHGAAAHIMEIYDPDTGGFAVRGMSGTPKVYDHAYDIWNVVYRTGLSFLFASRAYGSDRHEQLVTKHLKAFQAATGRDGGLS